MPNESKAGTSSKRPAPPPHSFSFSRRHASFDSPREVPLPSPSLSATAAMLGEPFASPFIEDEWELVKAGPTKLVKQKDPQATSISHSSHGSTPPPSLSSKLAKLKSLHYHGEKDKEKGKEKEKEKEVGPVHPYGSRPYSLPDAHSFQGKNGAPPPTPVDRMSSASLPLPLHVPVSALPKATPGFPSPVYERGASDAALRPSPSSSNMVPGRKTPGPASRSSTPSTGSSSASSSSSSSPAPQIPPYPTLRGPVPMPPPGSLMPTQGSGAAYRPPRTTYTPAPSPASGGEVTAINRRTPSLRSAYPPLQPPVILEGLDDDDGRAKSPASTSSSEAHSFASSFPSSGVSNGLGIGTRNSTASSATDRSSMSSRSSGASYEPFLSHAPPPVDSWIEVETTPADYKLVVKLPGFKRDGITLATKKRRILHVVADSWEAGGGHFERRISFGYDADLSQVRAEFDGELLRVIIPRRMPPDMLPADRASFPQGPAASSKNMGERSSLPSLPAQSIAKLVGGLPPPPAFLAGALPSGATDAAVVPRR
ncbi:unnamed protein product [Mycena citricolor]|uniref:SHSP domain-containing protein n=1 Tax=Mycena citricolor TaxID=2018698 RepID=A0AAD2HUM4_9AGAR|nr:unnamed protein product [Mycena citricolor]